MEITIAYLYPDLLNLYGDRGNILSLKKRCEDRKIKTCVKNYFIGESIDFENIDILYIGGGTDRNQELALKAINPIKEDLINYAENDGVILAVCGGFEMLGKSLASSGTEGLSLLNIEPQKGRTGIVGNIITRNEELGFDIVGFENHIGRIELSGYSPLGKVVYGTGNNDKKEYEGIIYKNVIGTYIHGPLLPKNPLLADYIIKKTLEKKYREINLKKLNDDWENKAHDYIIQKYGSQK